MCQNVPPLDLFDDELFNMLRPTWQNAVVRLCVRLAKYGDGKIADQWLRHKLLPQKRWEELRTLIIGWGWVVEDEATGNLRRAGLLAATAVQDRHHAQQEPEVSAEAIRKQISRAVERGLGDIRREMGLTQRPDTASELSGQNPDGDRPPRDQAGQSVRTATADSPNVRPDRNPRVHERPAFQTDGLTDLQTDGESDSPSDGPTDAPPRLAIDVRFPVDEQNPQDAKCIDALDKLKIPRDVILEALSRIPPGDRFKVRMARKYAHNILANRQFAAQAQKQTGTFDMLTGAVPGGRPNPPPRSPSNYEIAEQYMAEQRQAGRL